MTRSTSINASTNKVVKPKAPKRPLSSYNLFYRYKRGKVQDAYKSGIACKDSIIRLVKTTPGLEQGYDETLSSTQLMELSRANIRVVLLNNLAPSDTSKRMHRKSHGNSVMSFLEMNKLMLDSWKEVDIHSRRVFEELALEGRLSYKKRLAEFVEKYPDECISQPKKKAKKSTPKKKRNSKKYAPDMVESSTKTSVTAKKIFDGRYTPMTNTPQTAAARYVTPNTIKHHILPPPVPVLSSSLPHFDSLDVDLNADSEHSLDSADSWTDFADSFFGTEEEGSMPSRSDEHSMHCVSMDDLSLPSSSTLEDSNPRKPTTAPDDNHDDFLHLITMIDDNL